MHRPAACASRTSAGRQREPRAPRWSAPPSCLLLFLLDECETGTRPSGSGSERRGASRTALGAVARAQGPRAGSWVALTREPSLSPRAREARWVTDGGEAQPGRHVGGRRGQRGAGRAPALGARAPHAQQSLRARPQVPGAPREPRRGHGLERVRGAEPRVLSPASPLASAGCSRQQPRAQDGGGSCDVTPALCEALLKEGRSAWGRCHLNGFPVPWRSCARGLQTALVCWTEECCGVLA